MPAAKIISGSVVPAIRRARRTGNEGFGNASPGSAPNSLKHRRSCRISPRRLKGYREELIWLFDGCTGLRGGPSAPRNPDYFLQRLLSVMAAYTMVRSSRRNG